MTKTHNMARCPGVGSDTEGWRDGCDVCLRRTDLRDAPAALLDAIKPPPIITFECAFLIEP